ncbi:hypothetical protein [Argonema galeatum]|uniref:hypothetical protein n=1 Tax=Argonema galeatum TaxID=2942762 RepID=UPI00201314A1|nr:hypothetical protein [Argonema galeatum]MCL1467650.1 hypothetical protein [Argonema galeatum A003/A1]
MMLRNFYRLLILLVGSGLLLGATNPLPEIVNHPKPQLELDITPFRQAGCIVNEYDGLDCDPQGPAVAFGCNRLNKPSDLLGGLKPPLPLVLCKQIPSRSQPEPGDYFYRTGGLLPNYIRYIVFRDGKFKLVKNLAEFKKIFAPIESAEEALSYILAVKNLDAYYGQKANPDYEYFVDKIEDTHIVKTAQGYLMNLYEKRVFGCGPHPISVVNVLVTTGGNIREVSRKEVYKNPAEDMLCVD